MFPWQKDKDSHQFRPILTEIEETPIPPMGRAMFWTVVLLFIAVIAWTIWGEMDIVVSARGVVIPEGNVKVIQPLQTGVIRNILVKPGEFVKKGQPLVVIDPNTTEPRLQSTEKNIKAIQLEVQRLRATLAQRSFSPSPQDFPKPEDKGLIETQQQLHQSALINLNSQLNTQKMELEKIKAEKEEKFLEESHTSKLLAQNESKLSRLNSVKDIIAKNDIEQTEKEIYTNQTKLAQLKQELLQLSHQTQQVSQRIEEIQSDFRKKHLAELTDKEKQLTELDARMNETKFLNTRQTLKAPVSGYINELSVSTIGGVVTPAEKLISIVPDNTPLLVKASVRNQDIGFIAPDMPVAIKVDTFSFQKYGTLPGQVQQIAKDSKEDKQLGQIYEVLVQPKKLLLNIDGQEKPLSVGMSITTDIKVGKRRIIEFFIYPLIKYWNEGLSVR